MSTYRKKKSYTPHGWSCRLFVGAKQKWWQRIQRVRTLEKVMSSLAKNHFEVMAFLGKTPDDDYWKNLHTRIIKFEMGETYLWLIKRD